MKTDPSEIHVARRSGLFLLILALGLLVFVVFSHMRPVLSGQTDWIGRIGLAVVFLFVALLARTSRRLELYGQIAQGLFIALVATGIDLYLPSIKWWLSLLNLPIHTPAGIALDKLDSSILIVATVLLLNRLFGNDLASVYLHKGKWRQGLATGGIAFLVAAALSVPMAWLFGARDLSLARILPWLPWILIFIAGNAFNEELLFRGLFLKKFDPFLGRFLSNLVIAIPFVLHHTGVTYTPSQLIFFAELLPLALAWGYITQKTDSLWGAFLFHAGMDIPVVLVLFSTMT